MSLYRDKTHPPVEIKSVTGSGQDWTTYTAEWKCTEVSANRTSQAHLLPSVRAVQLFLKVCRSSQFAWQSASSDQLADWAQRAHGSRAVPKKRSVHPFHMASALYLDYCWDHELQKSSTVEKRRQVISIAKHVEEQLFNPATLDHIGDDGQRGSADLAILFCSKFAQRQAFSDQKLRCFYSDFRLDTFYSILFMIFFAGGTAASSTHMRKFFTRRCNELNFRLNSDYGTNPHRKASYCG